MVLGGDVVWRRSDVHCTEGDERSLIVKLGAAQPRQRWEFRLRPTHYSFQSLSSRPCGQLCLRAEGQMRKPPVVAVIAVILLAACTHDTRGSRPGTSEAAVSPGDSAAHATEPAPTAESPSEPPPVASAADSAPPPAPAEKAPAAAPTTPVPPSPPAASGPGTPKSPPSKPPAGQVSAPASPAPATAAAAAAATAPTTSSKATGATAPPTPSKAAGPPPLDLKGLEQRLRDTRAIGLFTKLSLKNQVDDLLAQFKALHQGQSGVSVGQLRQKYELLLIKVVTLLQDGDPALASAVSSSREAIWNVLADPQKFAAIAYST